MQTRPSRRGRARRPAPQPPSSRLTAGPARPLRAQLLQVRPQRQRGEGRSSRRVRPRGVEQLVLAAPALERGHEPPLAVEPVRDVLVELRRTVPDRRPVAGAQHREVERAQPPQAVEVGASRPIRGDEHAALAEHRVAGEGARPATNARWSAAWPGSREHAAAGRTRRRRRRRRRADTTGTSPSRARSASSPSAWSAWSCVSAIPPGAAARGDLRGDRVEVVVERRARVDDPAGSRPRPRVGARQRERRRGWPPGRARRLPRASPLNAARAGRPARRARSRRRGPARPRRTTDRLSTRSRVARVARARPFPSAAPTRSAPAEVAEHVAAAQRGQHRVAHHDAAGDRAVAVGVERWITGGTWPGRVSPDA